MERGIHKLMGTVVAATSYPGAPVHGGPVLYIGQPDMKYESPFLSHEPLWL